MFLNIVIILKKGVVYPVHSMAMPEALPMALAMALAVRRRGGGRGGGEGAQLNKGNVQRCSKNKNQKT